MRGQHDAELTAKLNDPDPTVWLADMPGHIPQRTLDELLPWN